jgi:pimeloyl-ACP methyl ester carboxylesterase
MQIKKLEVKVEGRYVRKSGLLLRSVILGILKLFAVPPTNAQSSTLNEAPFPESSMMQVQGVRYHYRRFEAVGNEKPKGSVLLIHGFASSTFSWRKCFAPLTQEGYEVIAVDIPPFGFSDRSPNIDHSPSANAERLWELIDRAELSKPWIVGHSMGARIAGSMGALRPKASAGVFLVDGPFFGTKERDLGRKLGNLLLNNPPSRYLFEKLGSWMARKRGIVRRALRIAYGEDPSEEAISGYMRPLRIEGTAYSLPPYFLETPAHSLPLDALIPKVHLIWGEHDRLFPHRMPQRFLDAYPHEARISVIQGSGHCPMETHPEAFSEVLLKEMSSEREGGP